ncbi:MAG TPA: TlyA family RNA methyltransferase [Acidimicrobiales bacterium]
MSPRRRLDAELVRRGLAGSRSQAGALIDAGVVLVGGAVAERASRLVDAAQAVTVLGPAPRFVGRGGEKLDAALHHFGVDVAGRRGLDAGASTGGFTDCLLQRGAAQVVAVDVGRGQLHERLRLDDRVVVRERTNIRTATLEALGGEVFDVVVADLSFISLRTVARQLVGWTGAGGDLVVLVKPQFEAGRSAVSRGRGVIRDPEIWRTALREVIVALEEAGATMMGVMVSPLQGADGNVEFLAHLRTASPGPAGPNSERAIDGAVAQAAAAAAGPGPFRDSLKGSGATPDPEG